MSGSETVPLRHHQAYELGSLHHEASIHSLTQLGIANPWVERHFLEAISREVFHQLLVVPDLPLHNYTVHVYDEPSPQHAPR